MGKATQAESEGAMALSRCPPGTGEQRKGLRTEHGCPSGHKPGWGSREKGHGPWDPGGGHHSWHEQRIKRLQGSLRGELGRGMPK